MSQRGEFFVFFVGGAALIVLLRTITESTWLASITACFLVALYAARVWDWLDNRPRFESAGDHVYYLGFLYTLVSLAVSLVQVGAGLGDDPDVVGGVLVGFGVAISSTIVGMALRVLLGRGASDDPEEVRDTTQWQLGDAARRLRSELDYTVTDFAEFRTRMKEQIDESARDAANAVGATGAQFQSLAASVEALEGRIGEAATALKDRSDEIARSAAALERFEVAAKALTRRLDESALITRRHAEAFTGGASAVEDALLKQADRIRRVDLREDLQQHVFAPIENELRGVVAAVRTEVQGLGREWARRRVAVDRAGAAVDRLVASLNRAATEAGNMATATADVTATATTVGESEERVRRLREEVIEEARKASAQVTTFREEIAVCGDAVAGMTEQLSAMEARLSAALRRGRRRRSWWPWASR